MRTLLSLIALTLLAPAPVSKYDFSAVELLDDIKTLSSDKFEGRGPGSNGERLTVGFLTDRFQKLGLKPGNPDGTFVQRVPMVGVTAKITDELTFTATGSSGNAGGKSGAPGD